MLARQVMSLSLNGGLSDELDCLTKQPVAGGEPLVDDSELVISLKAHGVAMIAMARNEGVEISSSRPRHRTPLRCGPCTNCTT